MHEKPISSKVESALNLAETFATVDLDDLTEEERKEGGHLQFGNNFYLLFMAKTFEDELQEGNFLKSIYLDRAKALGRPWQQFVVENSKLLADLGEAIVRQNTYSKEIFSIFIDFYSSGEFIAGDEYNKKIHPELGIEAIAIPIWRDLNSLLQRAAETMNEVGIDPEQFYA